MDIEKLIEDLRIACAGNQHNIMGVAAIALSTLQAENEKLRAELENYRSGHCSEGGCAAEKDRDLVIAENEKLRNEMARLEYERDYPCIYFKAGGLCRYGGDESEANICVMGPCEAETTAEDVDRLRAELGQKSKLIAQQAAELERRDTLLKEQETELERVKRERSAAVDDLETIMFVGGQNTDTCMYCKNAQCYGRGGSQLCSPQWRGQRKEN